MCATSRRGGSLVAGGRAGWRRRQLDPRRRSHDAALRRLAPGHRRAARWRRWKRGTALHRCSSSWTKLYAGHGPDSVICAPAPAHRAAARVAALLNRLRLVTGTRNAASSNGGVAPAAGASSRRRASRAIVTSSSKTSAAASAAASLDSFASSFAFFLAARKAAPDAARVAGGRPGSGAAGARRIRTPHSSAPAIRAHRRGDRGLYAAAMSATARSTLENIVNSFIGMTVASGAPGKMLDHALVRQRDTAHPIHVRQPRARGAQDRRWLSGTGATISHSDPPTATACGRSAPGNPSGHRAVDGFVADLTMQYR